jgi:hypothetical protein
VGREAEDGAALRDDDERPLVLRKLNFEVRGEFFKAKLAPTYINFCA